MSNKPLIDPRWLTDPAHLITDVLKRLLGANDTHVKVEGFTIRVDIGKKALERLHRDLKMYLPVADKLATAQLMLATAALIDSISRAEREQLDRAMDDEVRLLLLRLRETLGEHVEDYQQEIEEPLRRALAVTTPLKRDQEEASA